MTDIKNHRRVFTPRWQGAINARAINLTKKFYPALCSDYEFEDLLQEAFLVFLKVRNKYPAVDNPRWFMVLFSRALLRRFIDLKRGQSTHPRCVSFDDPDVVVQEPVVHEQYIERIVLSRLSETALDLARKVCFGPAHGVGTALDAFVREYRPRFVFDGVRYRLSKET